MGVERLEKVDDYGALGRGEFAVPNEIEGDVAFEESAVVVFENEWWLFNECEFARGGGRT